MQSHKQEQCIAAFNHNTMTTDGTQKLAFEGFYRCIWYGWAVCCHSGRLNLSTKAWYPFYSGLIISNSRYANDGVKMYTLTCIGMYWVGWTLHTASSLITDVYGACRGRTHFILTQAKNNATQIAKIIGLLFKSWYF